MSGVIQNVSLMWSGLGRSQRRAYKGCREKGKQLLKLLEHPSFTPDPRWTEYGDLHHWGWTPEETRNMEEVRNKIQLVTDVLEFKELSTASPPNVDIVWKHSEKTVHRNREGQEVEYAASSAVTSFGHHRTNSVNTSQLGPIMPAFTTPTKGP